jgi:DNA-binding transcriptional MerR regulator
MAAYKIKDIEVLTGIKAHTIRIWEKRYGILEPDRTDTQIRTYNDKDLTFLLNISMLNKSGFKISKIAGLSNEEIGELVWNLKYNNADNSDEKLVLALIELDERLFGQALNNLIEIHGLEKAFSDVIIPFLERIGVMWIVGTINPAQEHFISNLIRQKVIGEIDKLPIPDKGAQQIMLFLPEHEWHELGLLFYQYTLRKNGINTIYLGQSLPYDSLLLAIEKVQPNAILTSWLAAVDDKFIATFFSNLLKDTKKQIDIFAGGAQVQIFKDKLPKEIRLIKSYNDLLKVFN